MVRAQADILARLRPLTPRVGKPHIRVENSGVGLWSATVRGRRVCDFDKIAVIGWGCRFPVESLKTVCQSLSSRAVGYP